MANLENHFKVFTAQNKQTLKEWVISEIKKAIAEGRLKPGDRLNESKMAVEMRISKSPIREAINELVNERILISEPYKGTRIRGLLKKEVEELYSLRALLEVFAVESSIQHITEEHLSSFEQIVEAMEIAAREGNVASIVEKDLEFHHNLVRLAKQGIMLEVWEKIYGRVRMYMIQKDHFFMNLEEVAILHKILLGKLKERDTEGFKKALKEHITHYATIAINIFD